MAKQNKDINIFLAHTSTDTDTLNERLSRILLRAGLQVLTPSKDSIEMSEELIENAQCSVHLIGNEIDSKKLMQLEKDFELAHQRFKIDPNFNIFVWYPKSLLSNQKNNASEFLNKVQNSIYSNMIFSNHSSTLQFVEDVRSLLFSEKKVSFNTIETEIFFMYNVIDYSTAREVVDLLSDVNKVEDLKIDPNSSVDYSEFIAQQVNKAKLSVVYFQKAADWAVPFIKQIWKLSGGASINGNFLLIGEETTKNEALQEFEAPKVVRKFAPMEMIPLEIKVELDRK